MTTYANPYAKQSPSAGQPSGGDWTSGIGRPKGFGGQRVSYGEAPAYAQQGQAQSIPTQSQGTPYQAYAPSAGMDWFRSPSYAAAPKPQAPPRQTVTGDWQGSYAAAPTNQRPPSFQMDAAQTPWGQSMDPFAERNAFINQINQQRAQNQIAFNSGGTTDPTAGMTPGINYQQAMQQAGLGGGAPSMAANYGDSMISRLNQSFGGQGNPFAFPGRSSAARFDATKLAAAPPPQPNVAPPAPVSQPDWAALYGGSKDTPSKRRQYYA